MTTAAKVEKTIFEKKYITEAQARAAATKAGVADIHKVEGYWMAVQPAAKPAAKVTNKTPGAAKPAAKPVTNKTPAKPAAVKPALKLVPQTQAQAPAKPAAKAAAKPAEVKRGPGKPISPKALKARSRVVALFEKQIAADSKNTEVTVKTVAKALKIEKVTVSNTIRWAEAEGLIKRMGYKLKVGPGRKEVFYTIQAKELTKLVKAQAKAKAA